jgi:hypothetical protein
MTQPTLMSIFKQWAVWEAWIEAMEESQLNPYEHMPTSDQRIRVGKAVKTKMLTKAQSYIRPPGSSTREWGGLVCEEYEAANNKIVLMLAVLRHALVVVRNSEFRCDFRKSHAEIFRTCLARVERWCSFDHREIIPDDVELSARVDDYFDASDLHNVRSLRDEQNDPDKGQARECSMCCDGNKAVARHRCCKATFCGECTSQWIDESARVWPGPKPVVVRCPMCICEQKQWQWYDSQWYVNT